MPPETIDGRIGRSILVSPRDEQNARTIIDAGFAENFSQAMRLGLAHAALYIRNGAAPLVRATTP